MRITCDLDSKNIFKLAWSWFKGVFILLYKEHELNLPEVKRSSGGRGFHLIFYKVNAILPRINFYRKIVGDDSNRIFLDRCSLARIPQILFSNKKLISFGDKNG